MGPSTGTRTWGPPAGHDQQAAELIPSALPSLPQLWELRQYSSVMVSDGSSVRSQDAGEEARVNLRSI